MHDPMCGIFEWPFCFAHHAPMMGSQTGWVCPRESEATVDGSDGCHAIVSELRFLGMPYDLTKHPYYKQEAT